MAFCEPTTKAVRALAACPDHRIYRYHVCLSNPFPGSNYSFVPGHHFVELMYLFLTYLERYPTHRSGFFAEIAKEFARKWIAFANGRAPWEEFRGEDGENMAVFDDLRGFEVRTRERDEGVSRRDVWGERRYEGWEMISRALENAEDGDRATGIILNRFL